MSQVAHEILALPAASTDAKGAGGTTGGLNHRHHLTVASEPPRVLFLGSLYAGHRTRFLNLQRSTQDDPRLRPTYRGVSGWVPGGSIERLPIVPRGVRGRARAIVEAAPLAALPRPDAIWTSAAEAAVPYLWSQLGPLRRPLFFDLDGTLEQQEQFAPVYYGRAPKSGLAKRVARLRERVLWRAVTLFLPWSTWAAESLRRQGIEDSRIRVIPPGVDLAQWKPQAEIRGARGEKLHLLFVGGDFVRKGGNLLVDVFRERFAERCELDVVTRDPVPSVPGVRVHRAEPNSALLRQIHARADLFVLPTRAEFFGIASVEALASGLPVVASDIGGARDIVDDGETGWLIQPTRDSLADALERALALRDALPSMGRRGRAVAEQRFDGARNDRLLVDLIVEAARSARTTRRRRSSQ